MAGYSLAGMISYYLLVTIVDTLTAVNEDDWQIAADIKDGNISQFLLKPINYLAYRLCLFFSGKIDFYGGVARAGRDFHLLLAPLFCRRRRAGWPWACFLLSTLLTGLLQFFMSYTMALLAFWLLEVSTLIFMVFAFEYIAGGHLFPLNILPPVLARRLTYTPFPYLLYFPVSIYLGQVKGAALWQRPCHPVGLGGVLFCPGARGVEPRHPQIFRGGRMKHEPEPFQLRAKAPPPRRHLRWRCGAIPSCAK